MRRRGMKRYVPASAELENCDAENHRSKLRVVISEEKSTEDEESEDDAHAGSKSTKKNEEKDSKEGKKEKGAKEYKKEEKEPKVKETDDYAIDKSKTKEESKCLK